MYWIKLSNFCYKHLWLTLPLKFEVIKAKNQFDTKLSKQFRFLNKHNYVQSPNYINF